MERSAGTEVKPDVLPVPTWEIPIRVGRGAYSAASLSRAAGRQHTGRDPAWQMLDDFWLFLGEHQGKAASDQESKDPWRAGGHRGLSGDNRLPGMC